MDTLNSLLAANVGLWLLRILFSFFALSFMVVFVGLGVHKRIILRRAHRRDALTEQARQALQLIASGHEITLGSVTDLEQAFCVVDAFHSCSIVDRTQRARLSEALVRTGIESVLRKTMQTADWGGRYKCMAAIHELGWPTFFDALIEHAARETNMRVYSHCLYACAGVLDNAERFVRLYEVTEASDMLTAGFVESILRSAIRKLREFCHPDTVREVIAGCLRRRPSVALASLIVSIGKEQMPEIAPLIIQCAHAQPKRIVVVAAMRALHSMGLSDDLIVEGLASDDTIIQIAAIRASTYCGAVVGPKLAQLMTSRSFDVRYAASMTLRALGPEGTRILHEVYDEKADPYAKNMAAFALAMD